MARAVSARMKGDDYQALVFWKYAVKMLRDDSEIAKIEFENGEVKSFDDIVIHYMRPQRFRDSDITTDYVQVKFHVTGNDMFTFESLIDPTFINATKNSFLSNVKNAMEKLGDEFFNARFIIYSQWTISPNDGLYQFIDNYDGTILLDKLFDGTTDRSKTGRIRKLLRDALSVTDNTLKDILKQIVIFSTMETSRALIERLNDQFATLKLKGISGSSGTNSYVEITRTWIQSGLTSFSKEQLIRECRKAKLYRLFDGTNTDEYFHQYRISIQKRYNTITSLLDRSQKYALIGADGIYVDMYARIDGQTVLMDSLSSVEDYGNHFVVSAYGGYGKTMLMRKLLVDPNNVFQYVPVFISLRDVSPSIPGNKIVNAIKEEMFTNHLDISVEEIIIALQMGKVLLLLDGLDEVKSVNREVIEKDIIEIEKTYPNAPVIISSRPTYVSEYITKHNTLISICPLEKEQTKEFVHRVAHDRKLAESFCLELDLGLYESHKDFVDNPLLLTLMLLVYKRNIGIPDKLADFYFAAFECMYKDHDNGKKDFQRKYKTYLLGEIEFQNLLAYMCFDSYFSEDYDFDDCYLNMVVKGGIDYFKLGTKIENPEDFIFDLKNNACLLFDEGDEYRFIHRSFQCYFAASFVMKFVADSKQKLLFRKMILGDRQEDFREFFVFLLQLEGARCFHNLFKDEFMSVYSRIGLDKYYGLLKLLFKKIGVMEIGKGNTGSENFLDISDTEDFNYYMAYEKQKDTYLERLISLFLFLHPSKYKLQKEEEIDFCKLLVGCKLEYCPPRLLLMPLDEILDYPSEKKDKILDYHYRFYGIKDIVDYINYVMKKEARDIELNRSYRYYLAGIL